MSLSNSHKPNAKCIPEENNLQQNLQFTPNKINHQTIKTTEKQSGSKFFSLMINPPPLHLLDKESQLQGCNCQKSKCLKMYCVCFSTGKMCSKTCLCDSCSNRTDNLSRSESINQIITKDPFAFSKIQRLHAQVSGVGCNCRRSKCLKKYCDCFRQGNGCGESCRCVGCMNGSEKGVKGEKKVKME